MNLFFSEKIHPNQQNLILPNDTCQYASYKDLNVINKALKWGQANRVWGQKY
jgi:hypothetical protein